MLLALVLGAGCTTSAPPQAIPLPVHAGVTDQEAADEDAARALVAGLLGALHREEYGRSYMVEHPTEDRVLRTGRLTLAQLLELQPTAAVRGACQEQLESGDPLVAGGAALALAWWGEPVRLKSIQGATRSGSMRARALACQALGQLGTDEALRRLLEILVEDLALDVRQAAAQALGEARHPLAIEVLGRVALDPGSPFAGRLQVAAVGALGEIGGPAAVPALTRVLEETPDPGLRQVAARALGRTLAPSAVPVLIEAVSPAAGTELLGTLESSLRLLTYGAGPPSVGLGGEGTRRAAALWDAWLEQEEAVGMVAWRRQALHRVFPVELDPATDLVPFLVLLLESPEPWQRRLALEELQGLAGPGVRIPPRGLYELPDPTRSQARADWQAWAASQ